jgi:hypothetical protein
MQNRFGLARDVLSIKAKQRNGQPGERNRDQDLPPDSGQVSGSLETT